MTPEAALIPYQAVALPAAGDALVLAPTRTTRCSAVPGPSNTVAIVLIEPLIVGSEARVDYLLRLCDALEDRFAIALLYVYDEERQASRQRIRARCRQRGWQYQAMYVRRWAEMSQIRRIAHQLSERLPEMLQAGHVIADLSLGPLFYCLTSQRAGLALGGVSLSAVKFASLRNEARAQRRFLSTVEDLEQLYMESACELRCRNCWDAGPNSPWRIAPEAVARDLITAARPSQPRVAATTMASDDSAGADPLVSVCITHHNRPIELAQALQSIRQQQYPHLEVILVDDGSTQTAALDYLDRLERDNLGLRLRILRTSNRYLGAARNHAARHADGVYLVFMDDDNLAIPEMISTLVAAARTSAAPVVACGMRKFQGDPADGLPTNSIGCYVPLGAASALGVFENGFGDANALIERDLFLSLGGFTEHHGIGYEDWELFARCALRGVEILPLPQLLFWYRVGPESMSVRTDQYMSQQRVFDLYRALLPEDLADALEVGFAGVHFPANPRTEPSDAFARWVQRHVPPSSLRRRLINRILKVFGYGP
jgi:GT2 family glycosyltransferase